MISELLIHVGESILTLHRTQMPSYLEKVIQAIRADGDHRGTSRQAIAKHLKSLLLLQK